MKNKKMVKIVAFNITYNVIKERHYTCGCVIRERYAHTDKSCTVVHYNDGSIEIEKMNETNYPDQEYYDDDVEILHKTFPRNKVEVSYENDTCPECFAMHKINGDNIQPLSLVHGVSAYIKAHSVKEMLKRINDISQHTEWEIAATREYMIGNIGIQFMGVPRVSFRQDVYSYVGIDNRRHVKSGISIRGIINNVVCFETDDVDEGAEYHEEHFTTVPKIDTVWVKSCFWKNLKPVNQQEIKDFCSEHGFRFNLIE